MANLSFYAVCPFGLEELLAGEISACGAERIRAARGGVSFSGSAATAMAVCLNSRLASRVLMKVAEASYWDTRDIYEMAADTPWEKWFGPDLTIKVSANGQRCPLESIDFAVLRIKDGICDRFRDLAGRRPDVERAAARQRGVHSPRRPLAENGRRRDAPGGHPGRRRAVRAEK